MWRIVHILTNNFFELLITIYFSATLPEQNTLISKSICKACTKMFFIKKKYYTNDLNYSCLYPENLCLHKAVL